MESVSEAAAAAVPSGASHPAPPLPDLQERVRRLSSRGDPDPAAAKAALLLLAGLYLEHNVVKLARYTRLEVEVVARCARRLVDNGVWAGGTTVRIWSPEGGGRDAFWADVAVAEGKLCRRLDEEGRPQWAPGGHWWKSFDLLRAGEADSSVVYHSAPPTSAELPTPLYEEAGEEDADDELYFDEQIAPHGSDESLVSEDVSGSAPAAPEGAGHSSPRDDLASAGSTEAGDGDADEELAVHLTPDRPSSRNGSPVDLFPDAVWL